MNRLTLREHVWVFLVRCLVRRQPLHCGAFFRSLEMNLQLGITRVGFGDVDRKWTPVGIRSLTDVPLDFRASEFDVFDVKVASVQDDLLATLLQPCQGQGDLSRASLVLELDGQIGFDMACPPFVVVAQGIGISVDR